MASLLFSITRWRPVLAALLLVAHTVCRGKQKIKNTLPENNGAGNYNIPLWDEGKVPLRRATDLWTTRS